MLAGPLPGHRRPCPSPARSARSRSTPALVRRARPTPPISSRRPLGGGGSLEVASEASRTAARLASVDRAVRGAWTGRSPIRRSARTRSSHAKATRTTSGSCSSRYSLGALGRDLVELAQELERLPCSSGSDATTARHEQRWSEDLEIVDLARYRQGESTNLSARSASPRWVSTRALNVAATVRPARRPVPRAQAVSGSALRMISSQSPASNRSHIDSVLAHMA